MEQYEDYTYADLDAARAKGVSESTFKQRVEIYGYSIEKAINTPVRKRQTHNQEMMKKANENGISDAAYRGRIALGYSEEDAATIPVFTRAEAGRKGRKKIRKFTDEQLKTMEKNNIAIGTARQRMNNYGMTAEEAVTRPIDKRRTGRPSILL